MSNLVIKLSGEIQNSNFPEWKNELIGQIQSINLELATDADFATAELNVKALRIAEKTLKDARESAFHQVHDIQELFNAIDQVIEQARQARLTLERQIKIRKSDVKEKIALVCVVSSLNNSSPEKPSYIIADPTWTLPPQTAK